MKIRMAVVVCLIIVPLLAFAATETNKLKYGYDGVQWGSDLSMNKVFTSVPNRTTLQWDGATAFESQAHTNVILEGRNISKAEKVTFICVKNKLVAVSITVKTGESNDVPQSFLL